FSAVKYSDGSVSGEAEVRNPVLGTLRHFLLDCLNVFPGNNASPIAVASGVVTSAEDRDLVGRSANFAVQDNGEGTDSPPDHTTAQAISTLFHEGEWGQAMRRSKWVAPAALAVLVAAAAVGAIGDGSGAERVNAIFAARSTSDSTI